MFIGRERELDILRKLASLNKASLIVCRGRRRIGKSTLIQQFAEEFPKFFEFQGLAPREGLTNKTQLDNFARQLSEQFKLPSLNLRNWTEAFSFLAQQTISGAILILLDEVSWMGSNDTDFVGQLKIAWDTKFKKNPQLLLVICGSVTSWIDQNILNSSDFMGRVSSTITLEELPLNICNEFWGNRKSRISSFEKFKLLSITGGVPRYLEEIDYTESAEENIKRLCFSREGLLYSEFEKIFNDIFVKRAKSYREIVLLLADGPKTFVAICNKLAKKPNGVISDYLKDLVTSGLISRDYTWSLKGRKSKLSKYRLSDNYIRFYLKYIEPSKEKIHDGLFRLKSLETLPGWDTIMGLQLENLVINNKQLIFQELNISAETVISASSFFQNKTIRTESCQIDLLIHTTHSIYLCEVKYRKKIDKTIINEIQDKVRKLKYPKHMSTRLVLIYEGTLSRAVEDLNYFDRIIHLDSFLR